MHMKALLAASALLLVACGGTNDADTAPPATPGAQPAADAPGQPPRAVAGMEDALTYTLTMPAVRRWFDAQRNIGEAIREDEDLADELEVTGGTTVDAFEDHYSSVPPIRSAIERAGLSVREFSLILIALPHAQSVQQEIDDGASRDDMIRRRQVNPANLDFVRDNRAELQRMQQAVDAQFAS
jgi:hypothetical protein